MPYTDAAAVIERQRNLSEMIKKYRSENKTRLVDNSVESRIADLEDQSSSNTNGATRPSRSTVPL